MNHMSLYEIDQAIENAFYNSIDPETGEILDSTLLDELSLARDIKIENIACLMKNIKAEAEAIRTEEKKLSDRRRACENRLSWLNKYLANSLQGEKFKTARVSVSWRRSQSVDVPDVWKLPEDYRRYKDPEPDKARIKEDLKKGIEVEGAELVDNLSMIVK